MAGEYKTAPNMWYNNWTFIPGEPTLGQLYYEQCKGVSDLKTHLDYCEDPVKSCEKLRNCFPAQTEPFY